MTFATQAQSVVVNGAELRYVESGAGEPPLLFVHGWTCDRTNWRYQLPEFANHHHVFALDQRGHGESDKPDQDYTIAGFADDLRAFIEALGLDRPVVVGHSMGGVVALHLARRNPEIARSLVLIDSNIAPIPEPMKPTIEAALAGLQSPAYREITRGFVESALFNEQSDPALKEEILAGMLETPQRVVHTALASLAEEMAAPGGPVPVPTLHLRAATNINSADEIRERHPGIEVLEMDAAHFLQMERPVEVNAAIRGFIEGLGD